jgi:predicted nucleotidyltransferase
MPQLPSSYETILIEALRPYVSRIELFGSTARDEDDTDSDLDLLVTLRAADERPPLGLKWFKLERELSEKLGRPVELVTERALNPHLRPHIESDRVLLYQDESGEYFGERGKQGGREKYDAALEQVPDVEPDERDRVE